MIKNIKKWMLAGCMTWMLCAGLLTGCSGDTKIVFTSGLSGNQLFKIGSADCTIPEAMIYLTTFYNQYSEAYGEEMWKYDFGGTSLEEYVKDVVLSKMAQIKIMNLMAEEYDITLTADEKNRVDKAAEVYYGELTDSLKKEENITFEIVKKVYEDYTLANKVYEEITEAADMEISDDEARSVSVQTICFPKWKLVAGEKTALSENEIVNLKEKSIEAMKRIESGERFETVGEEYDENSKNVKSYGRGETAPEFEEVIFSLDKGECAGPVETSEGFYIVKCVSTMDYESTQENKIVLNEKRKKEAFSKAYSEIASETHSQFRDKFWNELTLDEQMHRSEADFFEIYAEYVKE